MEHLFFTKIKITLNGTEVALNKSVRNVWRQGVPGAIMKGKCQCRKLFFPAQYEPESIKLLLESLPYPATLSPMFDANPCLVERTYSFRCKRNREAPKLRKLRKKAEPGRFKSAVASL